MAKRQPEQNRLRIEFVRLSELRPDPDNPKRHDLEALGQSFARFGFIAPVGINETTGYMLFGHGRRERLLASRAKGDQPPADVETDIDGDWLVPAIRGIHLDARDGRAYIVADNRLVELGGWNEPALAQRLAEAMQAGPEAGTLGLGFTQGQMDALVAALAHSAPDPVPDVGTNGGEPAAGADRFILYLTFSDPEAWAEALNLLSLGEQAPPADSLVAVLDGTKLLERWQA
jgi:hypothetical protein